MDYPVQNTNKMSIAEVRTELKDLGEVFPSRKQPDSFYRSALYNLICKRHPIHGVLKKLTGDQCLLLYQNLKMKRRVKHLLASKLIKLGGQGSNGPIHQAFEILNGHENDSIFPRNRLGGIPLKKALEKICAI